MAGPLITELEVWRALYGLNPLKDAGPDELFPKTPVFARTFSLSLQTAQVPEDWRRALITLTAKKTSRTTDPRQFRPISLTSAVCKILVMILKEKLLSHLSQLSLQTTRLHGFLPRRSTVTNRNNFAPATKKARQMLLNLRGPHPLYLPPAVQSVYSPAS